MIDNLDRYPAETQETDYGSAILDKAKIKYNVGAERSKKLLAIISSAALGVFLLSSCAGLTNKQLDINVASTATAMALNPESQQANLERVPKIIRDGLVALTYTDGKGNAYTPFTSILVEKAEREGKHCLLGVAQFHQDIDTSNTPEAIMFAPDGTIFHSTNFYQERIPDPRDSEGGWNFFALCFSQEQDLSSIGVVGLDAFDLTHEYKSTNSYVLAGYPSILSLGPDNTYHKPVLFTSNFVFNNNSNSQPEFDGGSASSQMSGGPMIAEDTEKIVSTLLRGNSSVVVTQDIPGNFLEIWRGFENRANATLGLK